ncbi:MAG: glycosyltransferase family 2 protein [Verrucomicrobiota bacterium]
MRERLRLLVIRPKISACIMAYNEENNIRRSLESVTWCDEIVVVDSFSDDRTVEICREYTECVFQEKWKGYIAQRETLLRKASNDWVLFLDADEEISPELKDEILRWFNDGTGKYMGFEFPRQVFYLGRWIKYGEWNPDVKLRLCKKQASRISGSEPHDIVIVEGPVRRFQEKIWHYTYSGIHDHLQTMNRFSGISAEAMYKAGRRFRWSDILFRPGFRFFKAFVIKLGIFDGRRGFIIATISAAGVAMKYAKLREMQRYHAESSLGDPGCIETSNTTD